MGFDPLPGLVLCSVELTLPLSDTKPSTQDASSWTCAAEPVLAWDVATERLSGVVQTSGILVVGLWRGGY
jgi:hypothetical protein